MATEIRTLSDLDELAALRGRWARLSADHAAGPTSSPAWNEAAFACFAARVQPAVVAVFRDGELVALAPLAREREHPHRLEIVGAAELSEPTDLLAADPAALEALARALVLGDEPLFIKRIAADSPAVAALARRAFGHDLVVERPAGATPFIRLDDGVRRPEERLNPGRRSDLRRFQRRAEKLGRVEARVDAPTGDALEAALDEAFRVEDHGWKGRQGSSLAQDGLRAAFFRRYARAASEAGTLRIARLWIGGRPAAMQLAVEERGRFYLLKIGYDEAFKDCSPGNLLMLHTLGYAMERGLVGYELLGDEAAWTRPWAPSTRPCVALRVYPPAISGALALASDLLKRGRARPRSEER